MNTMEWCNEHLYQWIEKGFLVLALLLGNFIFSIFIDSSFKRLVGSRLTNRTLLHFWKSILSIIQKCFVFIFFLNIFGVDVKTFVALFGAIGISLSLALKDSISNLGSGFVILFSGNFKVGDKVKVAGKEGKIKQIQVMQTILEGDGEEILVPNGYLVNSFVEKSI